MQVSWSLRGNGILLKDFKGLYGKINTRGKERALIMGLLYLNTYIQQECRKQHYALNGKLENKLIDCLWKMGSKVVQSGNKARNTAGCLVLTEPVWVQFRS